MTYFYSVFDLEFKQIKKSLKSWGLIPPWLQNFISIGQQIHKLRSALGMTQEQLAKRVATSQKAIVRLEKEEGDPQVSTLQKVAKGLNCELIIRFVPKLDLEKFIKQKAATKAEKLVRMSVASSNLELQKPSKNTVRSEINRLTQEILDKKRSSLWDE